LLESGRAPAHFRQPEATILVMILYPFPFLLLCTWVVCAVAVTPTQKVIQLLNDMVDQGTEERQAEQVQFAEYKGFCDNTVKNKERGIKDAEGDIKALKADIEKYEAEAEQLGKEIADHDADISTWEGDVKAAAAVRGIENADYLKALEQYTSTINAVEKGIATLKAQQGDAKGSAASLLQTSESLPAHSRQVILKFLQEDETGRISAPEANAYESATTGITDMLAGLGKKFENEKSELEKKEVEAKHAHDMLAAALNTELDAARAARTEKMEAKSKALQDVANAKSSLTDTDSTRAADTKYVSDLTAECEKKSSDFANRQELRAEEIVAVKKAIEILSSGAVSGSAEKHLPQLLSLASSDEGDDGNSFVQLRSESHHRHMQLRVATYLKEQAVKYNSRILAAMATRTMADPFKKVKKMIKDLIVKLLEEAGEEAEHKGWCDKEMGTNKITRTEKTEAIEMLYAEIDELEASISALTEEVAQLTTEVAELDAAVGKATDIRNSEKAKNQVTIKDAKAAQVAVDKALTVLNEFYAKAAEATSFAQQPDMPDEPYKGMGGESGGVVGMIEVIQSDFARLESETAADEDAAEKEYTTFMSDSKIDKASKAMDLKHKASSKQDQEQALQEKTVDRDGTQKELDAAMKYYDKLKPSCVETGVSFEDRVARRKEEMESLKTALRVLNGEDIA